MAQWMGRLLSPHSGRVCRLAGHDPDDAHDTNWESVWVDLGGEG